MCNFLSAIVLKNGDVLHHPMLDSHSDLVTWFNLPDQSHCRHFAKVELTPVEWGDVATWKFRLDEETAPQWWDEVKEGAEAKVRDIAERMIVRSGTKKLLLEGCWILIGDCRAIDVRYGRVVFMGDSAKIDRMGGSAKIDRMGDSAKIESMWGSAKIEKDERKP